MAQGKKEGGHRVRRRGEGSYRGNFLKLRLPLGDNAVDCVERHDLVAADKIITCNHPPGKERKDSNKSECQATGTGGATGTVWVCTLRGQLRGSWEKQVRPLGVRATGNDDGCRYRGSCVSKRSKVS